MRSPKSTLSRKNHKSRSISSRRASVIVARAVFAFAIIAAVSFAEANEEAAAPVEPEAAAAEQGSAPAASAGPKIKPACRFSEHESRLTSYMARIRTLEKEIADMIGAKHHTENSEKVKLLTQQISFKYVDLTKVVREYEEERLHVRFQHPDRGDMEGDHQYSEHRLKSLDEIEAAFGLDGRLDRVRKQVGIVFPVPGEMKAHDKRLPASVKPVEEDENAMPSGIRLVK